MVNKYQNYFKIPTTQYDIILALILLQINLRLLTPSNFTQIFEYILVEYISLPIRL